jgi:hypothetical protein
MPMILKKSKFDIHHMFSPQPLVATGATNELETADGLGRPRDERRLRRTARGLVRMGGRRGGRVRNGWSRRR